MRIVYNSVYENGIVAIQKAAEQLIEAQRQVASGRRMGSPSADPLGSASAIHEHSGLARLATYDGAADAAGYRLSLADSALSDIINQLSAAQSTILSARGSAQTQAQRDAASQELLSIRHALVSDINTQFQGAYIFSGTQVTTAPFAESGSSVSAYQGDSIQTMVDVANGATAAITFDGGAIFQGADSQHVLDALTDLAAAVSAGDDAGIEAGLAAVERAFTRATSAQSTVGNHLRTIEDAKLRNVNDRVGVTSRLASIEDTDFADAAAKLAQSDTAYQAALHSLSIIGRISLMDFLR